MRNRTTNHRFLEQLYDKLTFATIGLVFLVILAGGIVRASGSGMGCPDWPKCFGSWTPPTELSQLPQNYKDIYASQRKQKNERLAKVANAMGFSSFANRLRNDVTMYIEDNFNPTKTWIEYINRLLGVLTGIAIILVVVCSFRLYKRMPQVTYWSVGALVLVIFQGILGAFVVSTNLLPWLVSVHLILAFAIVAMLIYARAINQRRPWRIDRIHSLNLIQRFSFLLSILILIQVVLGAQVRENVDSISHQIAERSQWIGKLDYVFYVHRSFAWVLMALIVYICFIILKKFRGKPITHYAYWLIGVIFVQLLTGVLLNYWALPPVAQTLHIFLSSLLFGVAFTLWTRCHLALQRV